MKLFDMSAAPNPRRVRIFLAEKNVDVEIVEVDVMGGENLRSEFLSINPRGVVPTLLLDDGSCIDESSAICRYFEAIYPNPVLYGDSAKSKALVESWIRRIEYDGYVPGSEVLRNESAAFKDRSVPGLGDVPQIPALAERGRKRIEAFFVRLNEHLRQSTFVVGEDFTAADITALCTVDFAEQYISFPIPTHLTELARWHRRVSSRPSAEA